MVARHYVWSQMRAFINTYISGCHTWQRNKTPRHQTIGLLLQLPIPVGPWKSLSINAIVKLPTFASFDSIMVIVCRLTKIADFLPFKEDGFISERFAKMFRFIFRLHGMPQDIVSDRGRSLPLSSRVHPVPDAASSSTLALPFIHNQTDKLSESIRFSSSIYVYSLTISQATGAIR